MGEDEKGGREFALGRKKKSWRLWLYMRPQYCIEHQRKKDSMYAIKIGNWSTDEPVLQQSGLYIRVHATLSFVKRCATVGY